MSTLRKCDACCEIIIEGQPYYHMTIVQHFTFPSKPKEPTTYYDFHLRCMDLTHVTYAVENTKMKVEVWKVNK